MEAAFFGSKLADKLHYRYQTQQASPPVFVRFNPSFTVVLTETVGSATQRVKLICFGALDTKGSKIADCRSFALPGELFS